MPMRPPKVCRCGLIVPAGERCPRCTKARRQESEAHRGSARERGYTRQWELASRAFLAANPLCRYCGEKGIVTAGTCVDHVIPHKGDMALFWDRGNWASSCKPCHDHKTATEDGGFGRVVKTSTFLPPF